MHILIVEDNPADAFLTQMALRKHQFPFEATVLDDGEPAIAYLSSNPPFGDAQAVELVILDLNLRRVDGTAVLHWIRANPRTADLPVFVLSSSPADAHGEAAAEATRYLEKPGTLDEYMGIGRIIADYFEQGGKARVV